MKLVKLAGRFKATMEFDQVAVPLRKAILNQTRLDLIRREKTLNVDTMPAASGVVVKTGLKAVILDLIAEQITVKGISPRFPLGALSDLAAMRKLRASGSGEYLTDPFADKRPVGPFGLSALMVPGYTPAPSGSVASCWPVLRARIRRHAPGVGTSGDDFDRNQTTSVFEERVLPAIAQRGLLTKITPT